MDIYLPAAEEAAILQRGLEQCEDLIRCLEKSKSNLLLLHKRLQKEKTYSSGFDPSYRLNFDSASAQLDRINIYARRTAETLYALSDTVLTDIPELDERHIYEAVDLAYDGIAAIVEPRAVHVRTPLLYSRSRISSGKDPFLSHHIQAFANGADRALSFHEDMKNIDLSLFRRKTICYLFVLNRDSVHIDNDNYDTTAMTNKIVSHFYGGDSPLSCRMVYDSLLTDEIRAGTYISVIPYEDPLPTPEQVVSLWKKSAVFYEE